MSHIGSLSGLECARGGRRRLPLPPCPYQAGVPSYRAARRRRRAVCPRAFPGGRALQQLPRLALERDWQKKTIVRYVSLRFSLLD